MTMPPINPTLPFEDPLPLDSVVTADLETLQSKGGPQTPFIVEWYGIKGGQSIGAQFELLDYASPEAMLRAFWLSLINGARGCTVYFHNWSGYDSILSLGALLTQPIIVGRG